MLRIVNWNISYSGKRELEIEYLERVISEVNSKYPCIIALEEVTEMAFQYLTKSGLFSNYTYSLNFRKAGMFEGKNRELGCFIGCTDGLEIIESSLINRVPFPERTVVADIMHRQEKFEVICFHSLTGCDYKTAKSAQFDSIADYLYSKKKQPKILCCDANEPEIDHYNLDRVKFFNQKGDRGKSAERIFGKESVLELDDSYRIWLNRNQEAFERIVAEQKDCNNLNSTPLAVSHKVSNRIKKRYDHILVSRHWEVIDVQYRFDDGIKFGSDHAVVIADLTYGEGR
jgi:endonuclease/exonuclease/phosphatase family metal-dependent hydrolase